MLRLLVIIFLVINLMVLVAVFGQYSSDQNSRVDIQNSLFTHFSPQVAMFELQRMVAVDKLSSSVVGPTRCEMIDLYLKRTDMVLMSTLPPLTAPHRIFIILHCIY